MFDERATRAVAGILKGRDPYTLEWREDGEDAWRVGTFIMNNDAKFQVKKTDSGLYKIHRLWFFSFDQKEPHPPLYVGTAETTEQVEAKIKFSIGRHGNQALHYPNQGG